MKDVNSALREKLYTLLNGNISASIYQNYLPASVNPSAYVIITTINNSDRSTLVSAHTTTVFQLNIYTKDTSANPGTMANTIAEEIYAIIYPLPNSVIDLSPDFQNAQLTLANDISPDAMQTSNAVYINRFISFRAYIYHP